MQIVSLKLGHRRWMNAYSFNLFRQTFPQKNADKNHLVLYLKAGVSIAI